MGRSTYCTAHIKCCPYTPSVFSMPCSLCVHSTVTIRTGSGNRVSPRHQRTLMSPATACFHPVSPFPSPLCTVMFASSCAMAVCVSLVRHAVGSGCGLLLSAVAMICGMSPAQTCSLIPSPPMVHGVCTTVCTPKRCGGYPALRTSTTTGDNCWDSTTAVLCVHLQLRLYHCLHPQAAYQCMVICPMGGVVHTPSRVTP